MITETLHYEADGLSMESVFHADEHKAGPRPGVLVFPEAFGLETHALSRAKLLAEMGYAALACDLHGAQRVMRDLATVMPILQALRQDLPRMRARAKGALDALLARPEVDKSRVAAIGFCFGGTMALELARSGADLRGVVGFHSGLGTVAPEDARNIKAKVMVLLGADDPGIDAAQRADFEREMRVAGVDWQMTLYGGVVHGFTNPAVDKMNMPERLRFDAKADRRSWAQMSDFFDEIFA